MKRVIAAVLMATSFNASATNVYSGHGVTVVSDDPISINNRNTSYTPAPHKQSWYNPSYQDNSTKFFAKVRHDNTPANYEVEIVFNAYRCDEGRIAFPTTARNYGYTVSYYVDRGTPSESLTVGAEARAKLSSGKTLYVDGVGSMSLWFSLRGSSKAISKAYNQCVAKTAEIERN